MAKTLKTILSLDSKPFGDASKKIKRYTNGMSKSMRKFNKSIGGPLSAGIKKLGAFAAAAVAAAAALAGVVISKVAKYGDTIDKTSKKTGIGVEELARWKHAAELSGSSVQLLDKGMKGMALLMYEAGRGTATYTDVLDSLGLKYEDLKKQTPEQKLNTFLKAIADVKDHTEKAALATKVFGRAGTELLPMLEGGAEAMQGMKDEADKLGIVMTQEQVDGAVNFTDNMLRVKNAIMGVLISSVSFGKINDFIQSTIDKLVELRNSKAFKGFVEKAKDMATDIGSAMARVGKTIAKFVSDNRDAFAKWMPILAAVVIVFTTGLVAPILSAAVALTSGLVSLLLSPLAGIMLAVVASFKIGDAIQQSMGLETTFAKMLVKTRGFAQKIAVELFRAAHPERMSDEQRLSALDQIAARTKSAVKMLNEGELENRNPADILIDDMISSFESGKSKISKGLKDLVPTDFTDLLDSIKTDIKTLPSINSKASAPMADIMTSRPLGYVGNGSSQTAKATTAKDVINKLMLDQQKKTNSILTKAVNSEGMTFA
jgi:uncharacterized protein YpuA (DUF1002 family)